MIDANSKDKFFMQMAIAEAQKAISLGEIPVGAIIVQNDKVIAKAHNLSEKKNNSIKHAEILCIDKALKKIESKFLDNCKMYLTLEPCPMCAGALVLARLPILYVATLDTKSGAAGSVFNICQNNNLNHKIDLRFGLMSEVSEKILKEFFKSKRKNESR